MICNTKNILDRQYWLREREIMLNFRHPTYRTDYQQRTISVFPFGDERAFFAQIHDEIGQPIGAAPSLYDTIDAAVNVCKDLIDFIYGDVDGYRERLLPAEDSINATFKDIPHPWYSPNQTMGPGTPKRLDALSVASKWLP
jgi:hypothetical protein